jgi:hypothetical protein
MLWFRWNRRLSRVVHATRFSAGIGSNRRANPSSMQLSDWCRSALTTTTSGALASERDNVVPYANQSPVAESELSAPMNCSIDGDTVGTGHSHFHSAPSVFIHAGAIMSFLPIVRPFEYEHGLRDREILGRRPTPPLLEGSGTGSPPSEAKACFANPSELPDESRSRLFHRISGGPCQRAQVNTTVNLTVTDSDSALAVTL